MALVEYFNQILMWGVILIGVIGVVTVLRPKPTFVVTIRGGKVVSTRGTISRAFLRDCEELCAEGRIQNGRIEAIQEKRRTILRFSRQIPEDYRQRFRNVWNIYA